MPVVQTSGFHVGNLPQVDFADVRMRAPAYGNIVPSLAQGLGLYGNLQQIADEAQVRPIRQRMAQIQLGQAENALAMAPLEMARQRTMLQQPIERVIAGGIEEVPRYPLQPLLDELGNPVFDASGSPRYMRDAGEDVFAVEQVEVVDPVTGRKGVATRRVKPISTMEQAQAASERTQYNDQITAIRAQQAETARIAAEAKAENDRLKAEAALARVDAMVNDPKWRTVSSGVDEQGNLVINQMNAMGELRAVPTGQKPRTNMPMFGATVNIAPSGGPSTATDNALDPDLAKALSDFNGGASPQRSSGPIRVKTKSERDALPVGTRYIGPDGKEYTKR